MKKRLTISLTDKVYKNLEDLGKDLGLSKSAVISIAIENYKKGHDK